MWGNSYFSYSPIDMHRSFCPRNRMSTPGTAAMSSMFLMQSAVSTCSAQMMLSLAGPGVAEQPRLVHAALGKVHRARPRRRVPRAAHRLARLVGVVDVGHEHAVGPHVQGLLDARAVAVAGHPHQRLRAAAADGPDHGGKRLVPHRAVLRVDQQPVVAAVGELLDRGRAVRIDEQAHLRLVVPQCGLELCTGQAVAHSVLLLCSSIRAARRRARPSSGRSIADRQEYTRRRCSRGTRMMQVEPVPSQKPAASACSRDSAGTTIALTRSPA